MALADLAVSAQGWIEAEFRDPASDAVKYLRHLADETAGFARADVPVHTGDTLRSIHVDERTAHDGTFWFKVLARRPVVDVLNSASGVIRNPGPRTGQLTRTGRKRRSSTGRSVRRAQPFMREALFETTKVL